MVVLGPNCSPGFYGMTLYTQTHSFTCWSLSFSSVKGDENVYFQGSRGAGIKPTRGAGHSVKHEVDVAIVRKRRRGRLRGGRHRENKKMKEGGGGVSKRTHLLASTWGVTTLVF